ncbi:MAG: aminoglycoside phosphotransferase family protein [bacterium]
MESAVNKLFAITNKFEVEGTPSAVSPIGSGHINDSYLITTTPDPAPDYVLQRINHQVFKDIPGLTANIATVTEHIRKQLAERPVLTGQARPASSMQVLQLIEAKNGSFIYMDLQGNSWRRYHHIRGSHSFDNVPGPEFAYEGGCAFGWFQQMTAGLSTESLCVTIPRFHDIVWRLEQFEEAVHTDIVHRVSQTEAEIRFIRERSAEMQTINRLIDSRQLPLRVTHNDTKFNNILFDANNRAICIVDLDTVMPGTVLYDFGDAIRTGTNTGTEDEVDLEKVSLDMGLFEAYSRGFLEVAGPGLTQIEIDHLAFSARFMTFIIGLRFLTDHINGDTYYKIRFPGHNLQRARSQFRLLSEMEKQSGRMEQIIKAFSPF